MNVKDLIQLRLQNQGLTFAAFNSPADVVSHFGAMQAQDYPMAKWAVGMRMNKPSDANVEVNVNEGEIIRTHILRPTWHFVSRHDIRWMMELSAPYVKKATQYVDKQVGLTDEVFKKAWKIIEAEFKHKQDLTKDDLTECLVKKKIKAENLLVTQILIRAELEMRVCNGSRKGNKITYALFEKRIPPSDKISKSDALVKLASVYFRSRGAATGKDFAWWSGLSTTEAKYAISGLGESLKSANIEGLDYLFFDNVILTKNKVSALLPSFDEYMVGYSQGREIAFPKDMDKSSVGNGIFKPIVMSDNSIVGTWKKINKEPFSAIEFVKGSNKIKGMNECQKKLALFMMS